MQSTVQKPTSRTPGDPVVASSAMTGALGRPPQVWAGRPKRVSWRRAGRLSRTQKTRPVRCGTTASCRTGGAHLGGAWALRAGLDLELHTLAADQTIEVERGVETVAMEEVFLRILGGDEPKAAVRDDLLDGTGGHEDLQHFPELGLHSARSVREEGRPREASPHSTTSTHRSTIRRIGRGRAVIASSVDGRIERLPQPEESQAHSALGRAKRDAGGAGDLKVSQAPPKRQLDRLFSREIGDMQRGRQCALRIERLNLMRRRRTRSMAR